MATEAVHIMSRIQLESDRDPDNPTDSDIDIKLEQSGLMIVFMSKNLIKENSSSKFVFSLK